MIAYGYGKRVGVIDPSTGTQRFIGHGQLGAWSPDGNEIAVIERRWAITERTRADPSWRCRLREAVRGS